jgi:hypothetical protein
MRIQWEDNELFLVVLDDWDMPYCFEIMQEWGINREEQGI